MDLQARELLDLAIPSLRAQAIVLIDPEGIIVGWLGGAELILGYRAQEIVGCHASVLFVPEDVQLGMPQHELEVARRSPYAQDDRWHLRSDGTRIWITGTASAIRDDSGRLRGFVKIMRDRTDLRMNTELRANQLAAVEAAMGRTRQFLHTLGHELRNPLAPIKTAAAVLPRIAGDAEKTVKMAQTISNQVGVLERLVSDLMDVSRLEYKKLRLELSEFDLSPLVQEQVSGHVGAAQAKGLRLECLIPDQPMAIVADANRLRQALANLLTNAVKYTPEAGMIWVKLTQEANDIIIKVQDTGIGISPEVLPRIFELFTQELRAKELDRGGLGVGLSIVSQIAELHGGVAQARSGGINKGSEFALRLPRLGPQPPFTEDAGDSTR
jgi:PAS domain S-box-containing protein